MRILVTGGAGFIGSHLTEYLCQKGHRVTILDRREPERWFGAPSPNMIQDCRVLVPQHALFNDWEFCYHLASTVGVPNVLADPKECIENIIESTRAVLGLGIPGIYFSTSEVYGKVLHGVPLAENHGCVLGSKARWSYAAAKLCCEWLAKAAGWKVVRLFNVVGPRQNMAYGAVLPTFVRQALEGGPITVHWDGAQIRTFLNVHDCVEILDLLRDKEFDVVNVGGNETLTILQLAQKVAKDTFSASPVSLFTPYPYGKEFEECPTRVPDLTKLHSLIGDFKYRSLSETINEMKEQLCPAATT